MSEDIDAEDFKSFGFYEAAALPETAEVMQ